MEACPISFQLVNRFSIAISNADGLFVVAKTAALVENVILQHSTLLTLLLGTQIQVGLLLDFS